MAEKKIVDQKEEAIETTLKVTREMFGRDKEGKPAFNYSVRGTMRGREVIARLQPIDKYAYHTMALVFGEDSKISQADLVHRTMTNKDDNGNVRTNHSWSASFKDPEDGFVYELPLKRVSANDEAILLMLEQKLKIKLAAAIGEDGETA